MALRIGVDVGGTSIDAACLAPDNAVLGWSKRLAPQSAGEPERLTEGVAAAATAALAAAQREPSEVAAVMLGTTQFVNAAIQLQGLAPVALVRLCGPATHALPPLCDMPPRLRAAVGGCYFLAAGGYELDGCSELSPLDAGELRGIARQILAAGLRCVVVCGVFSPAQPSQERRAAAVLAAEVAAAAAAEAATASAAGDPGRASAGRSGGAAAQRGLLQGSDPPLLVCMSHEVGQLGLLARENAAVLNAALLPLARRVVPACGAALEAAGLGSASLFITSNDGTLLSAAEAMRLPVATFQCGPVNSLRGAALLAGIRDGLVVDIGGTSTDVGVLVGGLPRPAPRAVRLAWAPTNFQAPDVSSFGLGGGSRLRFPAQPAGAGGGGAAAGAAASAAGSAEAGADAGPPAALPTCTVGPDSVGARLAEEALCAGGATPTATDAAVLLGRMQLELGGRLAAVSSGLTRQQAEAAWREMQRQLEGCVEQAKTQAGDVPVVVVGGGAPLCGDSLAGAASVVRPRHAAVANAVGAAIAQVGGAVDAVFDMGPSPASRAAVLAAAEQQARERALAAGARPGSTSVAEREEVPLAYLPGRSSRVRVKVVGELEIGRLGSGGTAGLPAPDGAAALGSAAEARVAAQAAFAADALATVQPSSAEEPPLASPPLAGSWPPLAGRGDEPSAAKLAAWQPRLAADGSWVLEPPDLHLISIGTGILGSGGGGSPDAALLKACMQLQRSGAGSMRVISPAAVPAAGLVADVGCMGAPTVSIEKPDSGEAATAAAAAVAAFRAAHMGAAGGGPAALLQAAAGSGSSSGAGVPSSGAMPLVALMSFEVGGGNGLEALCAAPLLGLPVVDGDAMGRAFPELQMATPSIYGLPATPTAIADARGNCLTVHSAASPAWLERLLRPVCAEMGASAGFSSCPLTGEQLQRVVVPHSLSLAWRLGHAVVEAQHAKRDPPAAAAAAGGGRILFRGKVIDVQRTTSGGFARGQVLLSGAGHASPSLLRIDFQNENLVARLLQGPSAAQLAAGQGAAAEGSGGPEGAWQGGTVLATVPDLICCVEDETCLPIATEEVRYGLRVAVLGLPAHPLLTTPEALAVVGPAAFGHPEVAYAPLAQYVPPAGIPCCRGG